MLTTQEVKEIILKELPGILENDPEIHRFILNISRRHFADKAVTEDRFDRILEEMRQDRERETRKWEANQKEQRFKWDEKQEEDRLKWEEQNRKWEDNQQTINEMLKEIRALARKHDTTLGGRCRSHQCIGV